MEQLPLENILLETDSPALGPEKRVKFGVDGKRILRIEKKKKINQNNMYFFKFSIQVRNEPRNIAVSAEYISKVKGVSLQTVMEVTTQNALRLFPKLKLALRP